VSDHGLELYDPTDQWIRNLGPAHIEFDEVIVQGRELSFLTRTLSPPQVYRDDIDGDAKGWTTIEAGPLKGDPGPVFVAPALVANADDEFVPYYGVLDNGQWVVQDSGCWSGVHNRTNSKRTLDGRFVALGTSAVFEVEVSPTKKRTSVQMHPLDFGLDRRWPRLELLTSGFWLMSNEQARPLESQGSASRQPWITLPKRT